MTEICAPNNLHQVIEEFDRGLEEFLESKSFPSILLDALKYSVLGGGKRVRPALTWYSSIACGGTGVDAMNAGIAVELVHAFSLIHDDLPALDDDDMRRGRPTLHKHTNEAMAILAGDALLSLAYESASEHPNQGLGLQLVHELSFGTRSMIIGQIYDTLGGFGDRLSNQDRLELIHMNKTGALLVASCKMGALSAGASADQVKLIEQFAQAIGLQFQVIDDLLDVQGDMETVGKATGKDVSAGKLTYPSVLGVERSHQLVQILEDVAQRSLSALSSEHQASLEQVKPLKMMCEFLKNRNH